MIRTYADRCLELAKKATEGPWKNDCGNGEIETSEDRVSICQRTGNYERRLQMEEVYRSYAPLPPEIERLLSYDNEDDMDFIASARTDVPELARRLNLAVDALKQIQDMERLYVPGLRQLIHLLESQGDK